jgi:hypothetical protein
MKRKMYYILQNLESLLTIILMQIPHFHVHVHVEDVMKMIIKLASKAKVHFVGLHYIIISQCSTQKKH